MSSDVRTVPHPRHLLEALAERAAGKREGPEACQQRVPIEHYSSAERFEAEREKLFLQMPQIVAHASQLRDPGDVLVYDWLGLPW